MSTYYKNFLIKNPNLIFKKVTDCEDKGNSNLDWVQFEQKCYYSSPDVESQWLTWQSAEAVCKRNGGFLGWLRVNFDLHFKSLT